MPCFDSLTVTVLFPSGASVLLAPEAVEGFLARNPGARVIPSKSDRAIAFHKASAEEAAEKGLNARNESEAYDAVNSFSAHIFGLVRAKAAQEEARHG